MSDEKEILLLDKDMKRYLTASMLFQGMLANSRLDGLVYAEQYVKDAVKAADFLLAELDKVEDL